MKKFAAMMLALTMLLSLAAVPVSVKDKASAACDHTVSFATDAVNGGIKAAENLNDALNAPGGKKLVFTSEGEYPWVVYEDAARSSNINKPSTTSTVSTSFTSGDGEILKFDYMSFGEGITTIIWDGFYVYLDKELILSAHRVEEWTTKIVELTPGSHTVEWQYVKDDSDDDEGDYATIDNVYVGKPIQPDSITVEDLSVPAGCKAQLKWQTLPEDVYDNSVSFSIDNKEVASVDAYGLVTGISVGTATVTVTANSGGASAEAKITVTDALPNAELYGYIVSLAPNTSARKWGSFSSSKPTDVKTFADMRSTAAAAFAGGNVYGYTHEQSGSVHEFYIMDAETMEVNFTGLDAGRSVYAMAYDYNGKKMYAVAENDDGQRALYTVDLAIGRLTFAADLDGTGEDNVPMTFAISTDGAAYTICSDGNLYGVDLESGKCSLIGSTGCQMTFMQSMTYDHNTNQLFWAQYHEKSSGLYVVNTGTGEATLVDKIGKGAEVTCLYTKNDIEIPEIVYPDFKVEFIDGCTNAVIETREVRAGTVLEPDTFPEPPKHDGVEFAEWDYDGSPVYSDIKVVAEYTDPHALVYSFETAEEVSCWTVRDDDKDGHNWEWLHGQNWYPPLKVHDGDGIMSSESYYNEEYAPLKPDNWLISPEFVVDADASMKKATFWYVGQDEEDFEESFGVYVLVNGKAGDELENFTASGTYEMGSIDLSGYAGQIVRLAFRHYGVTNMFRLNIDFVEISGANEIVFDPSEPPSASPTAAPSETPTESPSETPTDVPTAAPTEEPTPAPITDMGDVDGDGELSVNDALAVIRSAMGLNSLDDEQFRVADVDGDGRLTVGDSLAILRAAMELAKL